jgi:acrylyl-CoA reductase (NADPH)
MTIGTAGLTAMLALMALEEHEVLPELGTIVVSGASGGVGSLATLLLARNGYRVAASTGKADAHSFLQDLGANAILDREELAHGPKRPLDSARWGGGVDTVGGPTLAAMLSAVVTRGSVAACGLAATADLQTTVYPFILRGINLLGIDSNTCPNPRRIRAWERLASDAPPEKLAQLRQTIPLEGVMAWSEAILEGRVRGRIVVDLSA